MSRSYRKPIATDGYRSKSNRKRLEKRTASHKVRHNEDVADGNAYLKVYNSWNICDWRFPITMPQGNSKAARKARAKAVRK